jgi:Flp pilus assembly protein TadB
MKTKLFALVVLIVAASCSAPKYTYNFSYHDYQAGKRAAQKEARVTPATVSNDVVASTQTVPVVTEVQTQPATVEVKKDIAAMTKTEQKAFAKEVKKDIKNAVREVKKMNSIQSAQAMDNDLKMAAIFGAIGVGLSILFGVSEIIGFIGFVAVVVALVFLIKWLLRQ